MRMMKMRMKTKINWNTPKLKKEVKVGTKIEYEHTKRKSLAVKIAKDHISEFPDYYTNKKYGLLKMEKLMKNAKNKR